jgi:hypothetical protein
MSRVEEIEEAIDRLGPEEFQRFTRWFREREQQRWDGQLDRDSESGKLDFLFDEAVDEYRRCSEAGGHSRVPLLGAGYSRR